MWLSISAICLNSTMQLIYARKCALMGTSFSKGGITAVPLAIELHPAALASPKRTGEANFIHARKSSTFQKITQIYKYFLEI